MVCSVMALRRRLPNLGPGAKSDALRELRRRTLRACGDGPAIECEPAASRRSSWPLGTTLWHARRNARVHSAEPPGFSAEFRGSAGERTRDEPPQNAARLAVRRLRRRELFGRLDLG